MIRIVILLFAPTFIFFIQYFEFKTVTLIYVILSFLFLAYAYIKKKEYEDFIIITIYLFLLSIAFFTNSYDAVKFIPVFSAIAFSSIFAYGAIYKKGLIYSLTVGIYKKNLTDAEAMFLKKSDAFWALSIFIYSMILIALVYYGDDILWAFFSSIGWYIYFLLILSIQIFYGKVYAIKMYSK